MSKSITGDPSDGSVNDSAVTNSSTWSSQKIETEDDNLQVQIDALTTGDVKNPLVASLQVDTDLTYSVGTGPTDRLLDVNAQNIKSVETIQSLSGLLETTGNIIPSVDSVDDIGSSGTRFLNVFADTVDAPVIDTTTVYATTVETNQINANSVATAGGVPKILIATDVAFNSDILPSATSLRDVGSPSLRFANSYSDNVDATSGTITTLGNTTLNGVTVNATTTDTTNLEVTNINDQSGNANLTTGAVDLVLNKKLIPAVDYDINYRLGDATHNFTNVYTRTLTNGISDRIVFGTSFSDPTRTVQDFNPDVDSSLDLGSTTKKWAEGHINTVEAVDVNTTNVDTSDIQAVTGDITTLGSTTGNITTVNSTDVNTTNIEVDNIKDTLGNTRLIVDSVLIPQVDIIPQTTNSVDLGLINLRYKDVHSFNCKTDNSTANGFNGLGINTTPTNSILLGSGAVTTSTYSTVIGSCQAGSDGFGSQCGIGFNMLFNGNKSCAMGELSTVGTNGTSLGDRSTCGVSSVSIGALANSTTTSVAVGVNSSGGINSTALGASANAVAGNCDAFGNGCVAQVDGVAFGRASNAGSRSVSVGQNSLATGQRSVVLGRSATSSGQFSVVAGYASTNVYSTSVILGYFKNSTAPNDVIIGDVIHGNGTSGARHLSAPVTDDVDLGLTNRMWKNAYFSGHIGGSITFYASANGTSGTGNRRIDLATTLIKNTNSTFLNFSNLGAGLGGFGVQNTSGYEKEFMVYYTVRFDMQSNSSSAEVWIDHSANLTDSAGDGASDHAYNGHVVYTAGVSNNDTPKMSSSCIITVPANHWIRWNTYSTGTYRLLGGAEGVASNCIFGVQML